MRRVRRALRVGLVGVVASIALWGLQASRSHAGTGTLTVGQANEPHNINMSIFLGAPVSEEQLGVAAEQIQLANRMVCDMTDGQFRIAEVKFTIGEGMRSAADLWWLPANGRATSGGLGNFGLNQPGGHMLMYSYPPCTGDDDCKADPVGFFGGTLAHELGHAVFGISDGYDDADGGDRACPRGAAVTGPIQVLGSDGYPYFRSFFGEVFQNRVFRDRDVETLGLSGGLFFAPAERAHTVMQRSSISCRSVTDTLSPSELNPLWWSSRSCAQPDDCGSQTSPHAVNDTICYFGDAPPMASELATRGVLENDGTYDIDRNPLLLQGELVNVGGTLHPVVLPGQQFVVQGYLQPLDPSQTIQSECGIDSEGNNPNDPSNPTPIAALGEVCVDGSLSSMAPDPGFCGLGSNRRCSRCLPDYRACDAPTDSDCGNGSVEGQEQCDTAGDPLQPLVDGGGNPLTCAAVTGLSAVVGSPLCNANCTYNFSPCSTIRSFDVDQSGTLGDAAAGLVARTDHAGTNTWNMTEVIDAGGDVRSGFEWVTGLEADLAVDLDSIGESSHYVFTFVTKRYAYDLDPRSPDFVEDAFYANPGATEVWDMTFAMDRREFESGAPAGGFELLKKVRLTFDANRGTGGAPTVALIQNGRDTSGDPNALVVGSLIRGMDFSLTIDYSGLRVRAYQDKNSPQAILDTSGRCLPTCTSDGSCGDPDGCGGVCGCSPDSGVCVDGRCSLADDPAGCNPNDVCGTSTTTCGQDDGCGGVCGCEANSQGTPMFCSSGQCVSIDRTLGPSLLSTYARHEVIDVGGQPHEVPQTGACNPAYSHQARVERHRLAFNPTLRRYAGSEHAINQFERRFALDGTSGGSAAEFDALIADLSSPDPVVRGDALKSEWDTLVENLAARGFPGMVTGNTNLLTGEGIAPEADDPGCQETTIISDGIDVLDNNSRIMFVLDRSGSMNEYDATPPDPNAPLTETAKRLDFVKGGARATLDNWSGLGGEAPRVGLIWYNDVPDLKSPSPSTSDLSRATGEFVSELKGALVPSTSQVDENPPAEGMTATGAALAIANATLLSKDETSLRAVVLLTDDEPNLPPGLTDPPVYDDKGEQKTVARHVVDTIVGQFQDQIQYHMIPTGRTADRSTAHQIAAASGGKVTDAPRYAEAIPAFFETQANLQGQQLARTHRAALVPEFAEVPFMTSPIFVESGASRLTILISDNLGYQSFAPTGSIRDPMGGFPPADEVVTDERYVMVTYYAPAAGTWTLIDTGTAVTWDSDLGDYRAAEQPEVLVSAFVDNPKPKCYAAATKPFLDEGGTNEILAAAYFEDAPVVIGTTITGTLQRPDFSVEQLVFTYEPSREQFVAPVAPELLNGRGDYIATINCEVSDGAQKQQGENLPGHEEVPGVAQNVDAFTRQTSTTFFYFSEQLPPLPGGGDGSSGGSGAAGEVLPSDPAFPFLGDCDLDGIPDIDEVDGDPDGDGIPNVCDADGDRDDNIDNVDTDPSVNPWGCTAQLSSLCCTSVGACDIVQGNGVVLYADDRVVVREGTILLTPELEHGDVVNAGAVQTWIGSESEVGDVYTVASAVLREGALVNGDLLTNGTVYPQNDVTVVGDTVEGANIAPIDLAAFDLTIPPGGDSVELDESEVAVVDPGVYDELILDQNSVMLLSTGNYYANRLQVEPDATLELDMSQGPIYLHIGDEIYFHGQTVTTAGNFAHLFVAYLGTNEVNVETAFQGTIVAPRATIRLESAPDPYEGTFYAEDIRVLPYNTVVGYPFPFPWPTQVSACTNGILDPGEEQVDCGGECEPCPTCGDQVQNQGEQGVDCGGPCPNSCPGECAPGEYEAENMTHSGGSSVTGGWALWENGFMYAEHAFDEVDTTITVTARGTPANGGWPHMVVSVDGSPIGDVFVNDVAWKAYSFEFSAEPGLQEVRVTFDNDAYSPPQDRNLFVDKVAIQCDGGSGGSPCVGAVDLGGPGNDVTVANDACLQVTQYDWWWTTRTMKLESADSGTYPTPFIWSNSCTGSSGSGSFTDNWQAEYLHVTSSACPTTIELSGSGAGNITVRYWAE